MKINNKVNTEYSQGFVDFYLHHVIKGYKMNENLYEAIMKYFKLNSNILEIGSGSGEDFELLSKSFNVTGSDFSLGFRDHLETKFDKEFISIDAKNISLNKTYNGIFTNKVLLLLSKEELEDSLNQQYEILEKGGIAIHTFFLGDEIFEMENIPFYHYNLKVLGEVSSKFKLIDYQIYTELEKGDSIFIVLQK